MARGIFLIQGDGQLVEMKEQRYDSEALLQGLIADYPNLMVGDQINQGQPRRWLLVTREASVPSEEGGGGRWSVDHLFLDQDAIPTFVEVKRSTDTRIRREVIGQMLDYAANAVAYWSMDRMQTKFEIDCKKCGVVAIEKLSEFLGDAVSQDRFWKLADANLRTGKIRMVFVADEVPPELSCVVEFLNKQLHSAAVFAVEVKQYVGQGMKSFVPRLIGTRKKK